MGHDEEEVERLSPYQTELGRAIRPYGLKQLAKLCGVSYSMMQKVAQGDRRPNAKIKQGVKLHLGRDWREVFPQAAEQE